MGSSSYRPYLSIFSPQDGIRECYIIFREKETSNSDLGESSVQNKQSKNFFFHFPFFDFFQKLEFLRKIFLRKKRKNENLKMNLTIWIFLSGMI